MKIHRTLMLVFLFLVGCGARPTAPSTADAWAEMQRSLVGEWTATTAEGKTIKVSYRLISNQSALVETFVTPSGKETISVYHRSGDGLMLTHYRAQGNQARLRAASATPRRIAFTYLDATNVKDNQGVMHELVIVLRGGAFDQESVYRSPDGENRTVLHFARAK